VTVIEFHPEELLEREGSGTLSAAEQWRLAEHLARCASCRIEHQLRADFERELGLQTAPGTLHALVSGALRAAHAPERLPEVEATAPVRVRRLRRPLATALAAALALGTGLAAARPDVAARALDFARERVKLLLGQTPTPPALAAITAPAPRAEPSRGLAPTAAEAAAPTSPDAPSANAVVSGPSEAVAPRAALAQRAEGETGPADLSREARQGMAAGGTNASGAGALRAAPAERAEAGEGPRRDSLPAGRAASDPRETERRGSASAASPPPEKDRRGSASAASDPREMQPTAAALFDRANAARRGGSGAEVLYRELQARFPESAEARLSQAILGRMKLDSGDANAAVAHFETYLSTGDRALREQAMAGCALAWAHLGRVDRERQSWRALLAAYPDSSYAPLARQRLAREAR